MGTIICFEIKEKYPFRSTKGHKAWALIVAMEDSGNARLGRRDGIEF
jgi:hypothetical protein